MEIADYITFDDKNITFVKDAEGKDIYDKIIENLEAKGIDAEAAGLDKEGVLEDIIHAEVVTQYPYLGGDGLQGIIKFYRRDYNAGENDEGTLMEYVKPEKFQELKDSGNWNEIKDVFTLVPNSGGSNSRYNLVLATYREEGGTTTIEEQNINYQLETSKFATPTEFLIAQLQVTNDPKYIESLSDMVVNYSYINYIVQDQYTETVVSEYMTYTEEDEDGSENTETEVTSTTTTKSLSMVAYIGSADTWIVKIQQKYTKNTSGPVTEISNEKVWENVDSGDDDGTTIKNKKTWTETTTTSTTYVPAISVVNSGGSSGVNNSETILGNNETANKIVNCAQDQIGVPYLYGGTTTSGFDCSGLVQYCCIQAGANIPPRSTSEYSSYSQYEVNWDDKQPGDILWKDGHVAIFISGETYIHAPGTGKKVKTELLSKYNPFTKVYRFW